MIALLLASVALQAGPSDVVVTARARRAERIVARQIDAVLPPVGFDQPFARFADAICPGVTGLSPVSAQAVVDRMGAIADSIGLTVGAPGCVPNLLVIVAPDGRAVVKRIVKRSQGNVQSQTLADIRRIVGERGTARAWVETEVRSREGERATIAPGSAPSLAVQGASRAASAFRRDIVSAIVVIDAAAATSRDTVQIADYAAMRGLADARPGRLPPGMSVLSAFTADGDAEAAKTLTPFDRGLLRGLYHGQGNVSSLAKRTDMVREIIRDDVRAGQ